MKIYINGKSIETDVLTLDNLRNKHYSNNENLVTIINGFQTSDDVTINENDEIFLLKRQNAF